MKYERKRDNPFALSAVILAMFAADRQEIRDWGKRNGDPQEDTDGLVWDLQERQEWFISTCDTQFAQVDLMHDAAYIWAEDEDNGDKPKGLVLSIHIKQKGKSAKQHGFGYGMPKPIKTMRFPILSSYDDVCKRVKAYCKRQGIAVKRVQFAGWGCSESWARQAPSRTEYPAGCLITPA